MIQTTNFRKALPLACGRRQASTRSRSLGAQKSTEITAFPSGLDVQARCFTRTSGRTTALLCNGHGDFPPVWFLPTIGLGVNTASACGHQPAIDEGLDFAQRLGLCQSQNLQLVEERARGLFAQLRRQLTITIEGTLSHSRFSDPSWLINQNHSRPEHSKIAPQRRFREN
jgi:hypothetical protein